MPDDKNRGNPDLQVLGFWYVTICRRFWPVFPAMEGRVEERAMYVFVPARRKERPAVSGQKGGLN
jgi:hypothetical protein